MGSKQLFVCLHHILKHLGLDYHSLGRVECVNRPYLIHSLFDNTTGVTQVNMTRVSMVYVVR